MLCCGGLLCRALLRFHSGAFAVSGKAALPASAAILPTPLAAHVAHGKAFCTDERIRLRRLPLLRCGNAAVKLAAQALAAQRHKGF